MRSASAALLIALAAPAGAQDAGRRKIDDIAEYLNPSHYRLEKGCRRK